MRDGDAWVRSMRETVWGIFHGDSVIHHVSEARAALDPLWQRYTPLMFRMTLGRRHAARSPGTPPAMPGLVDVMNRWNDDGQGHGAGRRLLVWDPAEGWEPLCDFLEVDGPAASRCRALNDTASFREGIIGGALARRQRVVGRSASAPPAGCTARRSADSAERALPAAGPPGRRPSGPRKGTSAR